MDINQLISWTGDLNDRVQTLETEVYDTVTAIHAMTPAEVIDHKILESEERMYQMVSSMIAQQAKAILLGLNEAFRDHFENGDFEISEEEFIQIISSVR